MTSSIHREIHEGLCDGDAERIRFTRRAFQLLPGMRRPIILDVGCGKGDPTLELVRLTDGMAIGIDIDQSSLMELAKRAERQGATDRIRVLRCSIHDMAVADESFEVIWAEGSIHIVGFEQGMDAWRRLLKPGGFLAVHEMAWLQPGPPEEIGSRWRAVYPGIRTAPEYLAAIPEHGYDLVDSFTLPDSFWWHHYYLPLQTRIGDLRRKYGEDQELLGQLEREQRDIELYKKYPGWYGSAFFVMQKRGPYC